MLKPNTLLEKLFRAMETGREATVQPPRPSAAVFEKQGIILEQNKEPALSHPIGAFFTEGHAEVSIQNRTEQDDIATVAEKAEIVDESSGKPLAELLRRKGVRLLIADALDDEPYISSQLAPALQLSEQLVRGISLAKEALGAAEAKIEVYTHIYDTKLKIGEELGGVPIERVGGGYPVDQVAGRSRPSDAVVIGACALIHLARAVDDNRMQSTCFLTVAGDCVAQPQNLEVTLDKNLEEVLEHCGLLFAPSRVVIGGSMRGFAVTDPASTGITGMTRGVLAFREAFKDLGYICIGCGRCAEVCPVGLTPYYLYKFIDSGRYHMLSRFDIDLCIDCGTCSYICPAKLNLSATIAKGKRDVRRYQAQRLQRNGLKSDQKGGEEDAFAL